MFRAALFLPTAVVAGLFWSLGSTVHVIVAHLIAPSIFGVAVAVLSRKSPITAQFLLLMGSLAVAELVRSLIYCLRADGWHHMTQDGETQLVLVVSFGFQLIVGVAAWGTARLLAWRHR